MIGQWQQEFIEQTDGPTGSIDFRREELELWSELRRLTIVLLEPLENGVDPECA